MSTMATSRPAGECRLDGVERDGGRVAAARGADVVRSGPLRPDLELLAGGGAKRVRRRDDDGAAVLAQPKCELADRRRLSRPVDADDEHDARPVVDGQRSRLSEQRLDLFGQRRPELVEIAPLAQPLDEDVRRRHAHVGADERLLERFPRLVVERVEARQPLPDPAPAAAQRATQPAEEPGGLLLWILLWLLVAEQLSPRSHHGDFATPLRNV